MSREQEFLNAVRTGDQETFLKILNDQSTDIDPNHADQEGNTALILAAREGHAAIVDMLLTDSSVGPGHANGNGNTALILAAGNGHSDIVCALIDDPRIDLSCADQEKKAIIAATKNEHDKALRLLLKSSGQRLSVDDIANLTDRDQAFYKLMLTRTRLLCRARFRGIVRLMIYFRRMRLRAAEAVYAPGGTGYAVAADSFASAAARHQPSSTITLTSTETNNTTAGITQTADEHGEPATKK